MARGINDNWKQPLGYYFLNTSCSPTDLSGIIGDCIDKMVEIGLDARVLVSDLGSNFVAFSKNLGVTDKCTKFDMNGKELYQIKKSK